MPSINTPICSSYFPDSIKTFLCEKLTSTRMKASPSCPEGQLASLVHIISRIRHVLWEVVLDMHVMVVLRINMDVCYPDTLRYVCLTWFLQLPRGVHRWQMHARTQSLQEHLRAQQGNCVFICYVYVTRIDPHSHMCFIVTIRFKFVLPNRWFLSGCPKNYIILHTHATETWICEKNRTYPCAVTDGEAGTEYNLPKDLDHTYIRDIMYTQKNNVFVSQMLKLEPKGWRAVDVMRGRHEGTDYVQVTFTSLSLSLSLYIYIYVYSIYIYIYIYMNTVSLFFWDVCW